MDGTSSTESPVSSTETNETSVTSQSENTPSTTPQKRVRRNSSGRVLPEHLFKPGQSGNIAGRPKGSKNKITLLQLTLEQGLREEASEHMSDVLTKAIEMAKKGHPGMIKLLLELHMSKPQRDDNEKGADDKITININQMDPIKSIDGSTSKE